MFYLLSVVLTVCFCLALNSTEIHRKNHRMRSYIQGIFFLHDIISSQGSSPQGSDPSVSLNLFRKARKLLQVV